MTKDEKGVAVALVVSGAALVGLLVFMGKDKAPPPPPPEPPGA